MDFKRRQVDTVFFRERPAASIDKQKKKKKEIT